jgi:hypothetical protein
MSLEDYPGINRERKQKILAMSDAELLIEIEKGKDSIMPKSVPFMRAVLAERNKEKLAAQEANEQQYREVTLLETRLANSLSKEANETSKKANSLSKVAIWISIAAALITLGALLNDLLSSKN